ncbi:Uncharacterised protein [uncultured archaeon]|nr:Uncharacterised protein [uncultured archaeon]
MGSFISNALASAHKTLDNANKFQASAGGPMHHEYSNASHAVARAARKEPSKPSAFDGGASEAAGLKAKADNIAEYVKANP